MDEHEENLESVIHEPGYRDYDASNRKRRLLGQILFIPGVLLIIAGIVLFVILEGLPYIGAILLLLGLGLIIAGVVLYFTARKKSKVNVIHRVVPAEKPTPSLEQQSEQQQQQQREQEEDEQQQEQQQQEQEEQLQQQEQQQEQQEQYSAKT